MAIKDITDKQVCNEETAKAILCGDGDNIIKKDGGLYSVGWYLRWDVGDDIALLDGQFTAEDLEAIAFWMRRPKVKA